MPAKFKKPERLNAADNAAAATSTAAVTPLGAMLARHVIREGEIVLLALKPSLWFIPLSTLLFSAVVITFALIAISLEGQRSNIWFYIEAAIFLIAGRIMFAVLQWMGRLYVLTDMRIIRLSGVFKPDITDIALRKISRTTVISTVREKCCQLGTIAIVPADPAMPPAFWNTVARPQQVNQMIQSAIGKANQHNSLAA